MSAVMDGFRTAEALRKEIEGLSLRLAEMGGTPREGGAEPGEATAETTALSARLHAAEQALRSSVRRFRAVFDSMRDGLLVLAEDGRILEANQAALALFGCSARNPLGRAIDDRAWKASVGAGVGEAVRGGTRALIGCHVNRDDGSTRDVEVETTPRYMPGRQLAVLRDMTEQQVDERALAEARDRYQALFESHPLPLLVYDARTLRILAANASAVRQYGYERVELLRRGVRDLLAPGEAEGAGAGAWDVGREGGGAPSRHRRRDGTTFSAQVVAYPVTFLGRRARFAAVTDVSERETSREALMSSERRLALTEKALDAAANAIVLTDREGRICWVNPAFTQLTGYTAEEAFGQNPRLLRSGAHDSSFYEGLWKTILAGKPWKGEMVNRRKDGTQYTEEQTITPVVDADGAIRHFIAIKSDVSDRKRMEEQLRQAQRMEAIGQLAGGVAHDFNNLLTAINGYTELALSRAGEDETLRGHLTQVGRAGERAALLTRQLLLFSRRQEPKPEILDPNAVIVDLQGILRRLLGERIAVELDLDPSVGRIEADRGALDQVIVNLAVNARDAMPQGGRLTIRTSARVLAPGAPDACVRDLPPGPWLRIDVADTGCGMDARTQERLFEPFFTTKEPGKGTGLGLATVKQVLDRSGGHIGFTSAVGKGTEFCVYLPIVEREEAAGPRPGADAALDGTETVLLAEDDPAVRAMTAEVLRERGYLVLEARDGVEALAALRAHARPVDIVVTDVAMPRMDGRRLADAVRASAPATKVLFLSGHVDEAVSRHGVDPSGGALLAKPFRPEVLLERIRSLLPAARADRNGRGAR